MAVEFRLSRGRRAVARWIIRGSMVAAITGAAVGSALAAASGLVQIAQAPAAPATPPADTKSADCAKVPGGNAPVQRMARLEGGMSVRNLELTYFEKPLYKLSDSDIDYLRRLWPECGTFEPEVADAIAKRLSVLVSDARAARQVSLDWISEVEAKLEALEPGEDSIRTVHDLWQQMLNREFEMLPSDLQYLAGLITKKRDALYQGREQRQRTLISPFDPGPAENRDIKG